MRLRFGLDVLCLALAGCLAGGVAIADVLIESTSADGSSGRILISGDLARVETGNDGYWLLLELDTGSILAVNETDELAMDMKSEMPQRPEHGEMMTDIDPPHIRFDERRDGPEIAGFRTVQYRVMVDDVHCYDEFLAPDALDHDGIRRFVSTISAGSDNEAQRILIQLTDPARICQAADDLIDDHYPLAGIPMRTLDANGNLVHEITRIAFDQAHDPALFRLPAGYPVLSRLEVMQHMEHEPLDREALLERLQEIERQMQKFEHD